MDRKKIEHLSESTSDANMRLFLKDLLHEIDSMNSSESSIDQNDLFSEKELLELKQSLEKMYSLSIDDVIHLLDTTIESSKEPIESSKEQISKLKKVLENRKQSKELLLKWHANLRRKDASNDLIEKAQHVYLDLQTVFSHRGRVWRALISFIWYLYTKAWIQIPPFFDK